MLSVVTTGDQFGLVGGKNLTLQQTDVDGDIIRYSLTGGGTGQIVNNSLALTGTTANSILTITTTRKAGGDGLVTVSGITADGLMKAINASSATVAGDVTLNTGGADTSAAKGVAIALSQMQGGWINTDGQPISSLKLQNWAASDTVTQELRAPWIGTLSVTGRTGRAPLAGDMGASVILDGQDNTVVLRTANVAGTLGNVDAPSGGIATLTAGAIDGSITGLYIGTLKTRAGRGAGAPDGSATGEIHAVGLAPQANRASINTLQLASASFLTVRTDEASLGDVTVTGNADTMTIFSAGGARTVKVGGIFSRSRIQTTGSVNSITLGAMADSHVLVGAAPTFSGDAVTTNAGFVNGTATTAKLNSFTVGKSQRRGGTPQVTGTDNLSAALLGNVSVFNMESTTPPSLQIYTLELPEAAKNPASVRVTDNTTPANNINWRFGQKWPTLLQDMLTLV